jgi:hypothetical protein
MAKKDQFGNVIVTDTMPYDARFRYKSYKMYKRNYLDSKRPFSRIKAFYRAFLKYR